MERSSEFIVDNIHLNSMWTKDHVFGVLSHQLHQWGLGGYREGRPSYHIRHNKRYISVPDIIKPYKFYFRIDEDKLHQLEEDELDDDGHPGVHPWDMENRFLVHQ